MNFFTNMYSNLQKGKSIDRKMNGFYNLNTVHTVILEYFNIKE